MLSVPFNLYGEDDEIYAATAMISPLAERMPESGYWKEVEAAEKQTRSLANISFQLYSDSDPFYRNTAMFSPCTDQLPTREYWENYEAHSQPLYVPKATVYIPEEFMIGKQILMHLGGSAAFLSTIGEPDEMPDIIDGSGIDFKLSKEREKFMPELKRRTRYVPHEQTPEIIDVEPTNWPIVPDAIKLGPARSDLRHSNFCEEQLITTLFGKKDLFQTINEQQFEQARRKANPYEKIGKAIFMNRAAVKMANLDFLFNLTNTSRFKKPSASDVPPNEVFYFADICAGPGGFTEYLYWRIGHDRAQGFGMTLKGDHDWARNERFMVPIEGFVRHYGQDLTGNIFRIENIYSFEEEIRDRTHGQMVSLVTADGGTAVDGQENDQEMLLKRLVLCQYLCALCILRKGGNFICKVFDILTDFNASLLYVVAQCFERISIVKPYTSRPANSERYVAFLGLKEAKPMAVIGLLSEANDIFQKLEDSGRNEEDDIMSVFPIEKIPPSFGRYLTESNEKLAKQQTDGVDEFLIYAFKSDIEPLDQDDIAQRCLRHWNVPRNAKEKDEYRRDEIRRERAMARPPPPPPMQVPQPMPQVMQPPRPKPVIREVRTGKYSLLGNEILQVWGGIEEREKKQKDSVCAVMPILEHEQREYPPTFFKFWDGKSDSVGR